MEDADTATFDSDGSQPSSPVQHSRPRPLDLTGAEIISTTHGDEEEDAPSGGVGAGPRSLPRPARDAPSIVLPNQDAQYITHIALDIGGSLVKLVYFSRDEPQGKGAAPDGSAGHGRGGSQTGGKLHFVKFETSDIDKCLEFIEAKGLHRFWHKGGANGLMRVKATGGGAFKFAEEFKSRLGLLVEKEDEMRCLVDGCNFLCRAIRHEAFTYENHQTHFVVTNSDSELFPYLLVNIGSGVSMVRVSGEGQYERVSGSSLGGGTFWGLCRLLTGCGNFDEILDMCARGDNSKVDMLVGDIYGGRDYSSIGLSANTIASSFGKVVGDDNGLEAYNPADLALAALRMISYNIGQLAYLNAKRYGLTRIFFGGFFIRGHPYTMETISFAIRFWSKGEMAAMFLRHEGFLGAVGAFLKVHPMTTPDRREPRKVRSRFIERWPMGAPYSGCEVHGPAIRDMGEKVSWVERFVQVGTAATEAARSEHDKAQQAGWELTAAQQQQQQQQGGVQQQQQQGAVQQQQQPGGVGGGQQLIGSQQRSGSSTSVSDIGTDLSKMLLHVGILHYQPQCEPFPLLTDPVAYDPNTIDIHARPDEMAYWTRVLAEQVGAVAEKAVAAEEGSSDAQRRAAAFARAFSAHLERLQTDSGAYGQLGLAELFELREECLHEFGFQDIYRRDKERENAAALEVLPDLLQELDGLPQQDRILALVQGVLAGNIFDWGARATVALYHNGTILEIYRQARSSLSQRPWRVDHFDALAAKWVAAAKRQGGSPVGRPPPSSCCPYRRAIMFVDNAGADVVLGMLPLARELLRGGAEVVLAANSQPAINDITAAELTELIAKVSEMDPTIAAARQAAIAAVEANDGTVPPVPGLPRRVPSTDRLNLLALGGSGGGNGGGGSPSPRNTPTDASSGPGPPWPDSQAATAAGQGAGAASCQPAAAQRFSASGSGNFGSGSMDAQGPAAGASGSPSPPRSWLSPTASLPPRPSPDGRPDGRRDSRRDSFEHPQHHAGSSPSGAFGGGGFGIGQQHPPSSSSAGACGMGSPDHALPYAREPKLYVVASGSGSPCLDLRRVSGVLADATVGADLVVIEGMGRAIHTNYATRLRCDCLKLAMIKNKHLARELFGGDVYDCVCRFDAAL